MKQLEIKDLLFSRRFDAEQEPPKEEIIFRIDFQTIGSLGEYSLITGRPKAGKSKYLAGAIASAISREQVFGMTFKLPDHKRRVVHFDTEQGKRSHYNLLRLVCALAKMPMPENFDSFHCRQDNATNIMLMIDYYLKTNTESEMTELLSGLPSEVAIDIIGEIPDVSGYHVNVRVMTELEDWQEAGLEAHSVTVNSPYRTWA